MPGDAVHELFIRVFAAKRVVIDEGWNTRNVRSSYWRLYVNKRVGAWVELEDGRYALPPGRVHFIPAWVGFSCHNRRPIEHLYAHFDVVGWTGALVRAVFDAPASVELDAGLRALCEALDFDADGGGAVARELRVKALVQLALARRIDGLPADRRARLAEVGDEEAQIGPALRLIENDLHLPLDNATLAAACHLSPDHFIRVFRRRIGQTPAQYVTERRLARAAERLVFTADKIDAIAEACGFPNRFYFSRVFTRRMGLPPAAYRSAARV